MMKESKKATSTHVLSVIEQDRTYDVDNAPVVDDTQLCIEEDHTETARQDDQYCP